MGKFLDALGLELPSGMQPQGEPPQGRPRSASDPGPRSTVASSPPKADPNLTVAARADFEHGSIADIPATIAALVQRTGDGVVSYDPPLDTVGAAQKYTIDIRVAEGTAHRAAGPVPLSFEILKADPKLVVGKLEDFDHGTVADLPQAIAAVVKHEGDGVVRYEPTPDSIAAPGKYTVQVSVEASATHKAAGPLPLGFEIRKLPTTLTLKQLDNFFHDPNKKKNLSVLIAGLVSHDGDGKPVYDPPLVDLQDKPGDYSVTIWVGEGALRKKSEEKQLTFKIFLSHAERNNAFQAWKQNATDKQKNMVGKKQAATYVGEIYDRNAPVPEFTSADEIRDALNRLVKADIPTKDLVWAALGHDSLKGKADWKIAGNWETSKGVKMHLTISYDSIQVPQAKAGWSGQAAALYTGMFEGPPIASRVHMTLESAATDAGKVHVFVGGTNGAGRAWDGNAFDGQIGEMMAKLTEFRNTIVGKIPAAKIALRVP